MNVKKAIRFMKEGLFFYRLKTRKLYEKYGMLGDDLTIKEASKFLNKKYGKFCNEYEKCEKSQNSKPKIIWWCWLQGEENAPDLCKGALESLRRHYPDFKINIITSKNMLEYITLPDYIIDKYNKGLITHTHFSDILRAELLVEHGGTWIDSSVFCTKRSNILEKDEFFVYKSFLKSDYSIVASSWLISAEKNNNIIRMTRDLLLEYWKKHNILIHYYLFHLFFTMATKKYSEEWNLLNNYPNANPHILQFEMFDEYDAKRMNEIKYFADFHKLTQKSNITNYSKNSYYAKISNGETL